MPSMQLDFDFSAAVVGVGLGVLFRLAYRVFTSSKGHAKGLKVPGPSDKTVVEDPDGKVREEPTPAQDQDEPVPEPAPEEPVPEPAQWMDFAASATRRVLRPKWHCPKSVVALCLVAVALLVLGMGNGQSDSSHSGPRVDSDQSGESRSSRNGTGQQVLVTVVPALDVSSAPADMQVADRCPAEEAARNGTEGLAREEEGGPAGEQEAGQELAEAPQALPADEELEPCTSCAQLTERDREDFVSEAPLIVKLTRQGYDSLEADYVRSAYYGTLLVGTPGIEMTVVFDTGSGHLILPSMYCKSEACKAHTRYRRSGSVTGRDINHDGQGVEPGQPRESSTIAFGTGEVSGVYVEDIICVGELNKAASNFSNGSSPSDDSEGLEPGCTKMRFIAATALSEDPFKDFFFDGVLGMGFTPLSQTPEFNFMTVVGEHVRQLGSRSPKTFGVFLADSPVEDSEIALGGWSRRHLAEDLSWGPVLEPEHGHWIVHIRSIRVDNWRLDYCDDGSCKAAVDTGTSLLAVPTDAFRELYGLLAHPTSLTGGCKGPGPLLHFELDHFTVSVGPREYAQVRTTGRKAVLEKFNATGLPAGRRDLRCLPALMTMDLPEPLGPKLFILGEPVLRKYYTAYDGANFRVGFGAAQHRRFPSRDEVLAAAPALDRAAGRHQASSRRPTMFDVFRWRKAMQQQ